ncbi:NAD(P)H-hydrate epimerase [Cereibacter sediminicola]|uniref:NAD(P)H-hydrate epimerase n=1 Tax=Cereibacter sediminicola TaxID=2584941 RepID=UPI0011A19A84
MRAIEAAAMEAGTVTGLQLMERAGEGVVQAVLAQWPQLDRAAEALVLCGPGNNGGDGFVVARLLWARGWKVTVFAHGWEALFPPDGVAREPGSRSGGDAWTNARRWRDLGGACHPLGTLPELGRDPPERLLVVDALLGIGQTRPADELLRPFWTAWDRWSESGLEIRKVSVDVPTGCDCDTGEPLGQRPFEPDLVVTFHAEKPVHARLRAEGVRVVVADIGLPA